jgi:hypothetical protein
MKQLTRFALACIITLVAIPSYAQRLQLQFDHLEAKADESVEVTLDGEALRMATRFLSDRNPDEREVRKLISGLEGIWVRSYEFSSPGAWSEADIERIRRQLTGWQKIVNVRSRKNAENVEIYISDTGRSRGIVIIAAEPSEFTVVHIAGDIDLARVGQLEGRLGVPRLEIESQAKGSRK